MQLVRYGSVDTGIRPREVVLLRSMPCSWGRCTFCDYCEDNTVSVATAQYENERILQQVTGKHGVLQVIDSASWAELPTATMFEILCVCKWKKIHTVILEGHWMYKADISTTEKFFAAEGVKTEFILGLESTKPERRAVLNKGVPSFLDPGYFCNSGFTWVNLLYGDNKSSAPGRFYADEVLSCSKLFDYVNISIFTNNSVAEQNGIFRDVAFVEEFYRDGWCSAIKALGNVFVFDYGDSRAPDNLGGVGNTI